jgi:hypothetical protein
MLLELFKPVLKEYFLSRSYSIEFILIKKNSQL